MKPETKPFYKTSEFWVLVLANLVSVITALKGYMNAETYVIASSVLNGAYAVARGLAKSGSEYKPE